MNHKDQTNCSSCQVYDWCFLICCPIAHLCNQCLLDSNIFNEYYVCPNCDRPIGKMYTNMVDQAQQSLQEINMARHIHFNNYGNTNNRITRTNSFTSLNMNCNQTQQQEFQFVQNSRQQNQMTLKRNNFNQYCDTTNMNINNLQNRNNFTRQQGGGMLRDMLMNPTQQNMSQMNGNYNQRQQINNFNGQFNNNNGMFNNNNRNMNYNNYQQQNNNFNVNQQFNQQRQHTNSFTTNIRRTQQQQNQSEEFFFQDEIQQQQRFRSKGITTGNNSGTGNNFNFTSNQTNNNRTINNNPFNQQNNFIPNNRTNKNIHLNNFNQSNKNLNGQNHTFDQQNEFFVTDQRMVKSATKIRRNDFSPNNFKRNNFKPLQNSSFSNQISLIDDKSGNSEKDLSPTFGQGDTKERENFEFEGRGNMINEEKHEIMNLKKSGSSYTLG